MTFIYILSLQHGRFYVGYSAYPLRRIQRHYDGTGAQWTKRWRVSSIINIYETKNLWEEDIQTKSLMYTHGIMKVRGGSYSSVSLSPNQIFVLQTEIDTATRRCFTCGQSFGNAHVCSANTLVTCYYCKQQGHRVKECPMLQMESM